VKNWNPRAGGASQQGVCQHVYLLCGALQRVGYEDGLNFWGGATVNDPNGELLAQGPYFEEALTVTRLDLNQLRRTRARLPLLRDERTNLTMSELQRILQK